MILSVAFLDIFHGDCAVVTLKDRDRKACIVIDGGEIRNAAKRLATYLKHEGVEVIDLLVATHIDSDHVQGLVQFLKHESGRIDSWNKGRQKCIRRYWGPKADPSWVPSPKRKSIGVLPLGATQLRTKDFVMQSVAQNQNLIGLVEKHIINNENISHPSLEEMPVLDIIENIRLDVLAPDTQIFDSAIQSIALNVSNAAYKQTLTRKVDKRNTKPLTLQDLHMILQNNAEEMAKIADRNANNQSIVFKITAEEGRTAQPKSWSFLFTGDAEQESWEMMRQRVQDLSATVLKVPHHGSSLNGIDKKSFKLINPQYSVISVGQKHGLPDSETLNLIKADKKRKLFCTERNNNKKHPGPCIGKTGCLRKKVPDFRSIRFVIDTSSGDEKIETFTINEKTENIQIKNGDIWCPESKW